MSVRRTLVPMLALVAAIGTVSLVVTGPRLSVHHE